jgi:hypothetical protein
MRIDNSMAKAWRKCPLEYYEKYIAKYTGSELVGIETARGNTTARDFGKRMHELLHEHREPGIKPVFPEAPDAAIEAEAQSTFAAYLAHYPVEPFTVVQAERTQVVPLFDSMKRERHQLIVKLDTLVRNRQGELQVLDVKTQNRASNNNDAEHWAARPQVALYVYAARLLYPKEKVSDEVIIDLIRRQSDKGLVGPEFHREHPRRNALQIHEAVLDLIWVADRIEEMERSGFWPTNRDACKVGNWKCDYFDLHNFATEARADILRKSYKPAEPYLELPSD